MRKWISVILLATMLSVTGVGIYYLYTLAYPKKILSGISFEEGMKLVSDNCQKEHIAISDQSSIDQFSQLFSTLGGDVTYDTKQQLFISATGKPFAMTPVDPTYQQTTSKRLLNIVPTPEAQKSYCWIAEFQDAPGIGRIAWKTENGPIKIIKINNLPSFSQ